ncbi:MFS transporter [bacterium]|nr:MFS transporter [bacterium]
MANTFSPRERKILWVLAAVQFVNVLDFMMVMPMGPDLAHSLGIPLDQLGLVGGSYTMAAFVAGVLGSFVLDRLNRKTVLIYSLAGLVLATWSATFATGLHSLLAARVAAGFFGGPATSAMLAMVSDVISPERRGRALGLVMAAFSIASILGVPVGLELAHLGGWQLPFWVVGALGALVTAGAQVLLPPHPHPQVPSHSQTAGSKHAWIWSPLVLLSFAGTSLSVLSSFMLIPNLSAFLQFNAGWPREKLGLLYFAGGTLSLFSTRMGGGWNDRVGSMIPITCATAVLAVMLYWGMLTGNPPGHPQIFVLPWFAAFMLANSLRWISMSTLTSKVPLPHQRARYMSILSAVQHLSSASGAIVSTRLLRPGPGGSLEGIPTLALTAIVLGLLVPGVVYWVEKRLNARPIEKSLEDTSAIFEGA